MIPGFKNAFRILAPVSPRTIPATAADAELLSFAEIISALSFAIDLTEGAVPGHAVRCCILGMRIAEKIGLSKPQQTALYYALLLKDAGCSNNATRLTEAIAAHAAQAAGAAHAAGAASPNPAASGPTLANPDAPSPRNTPHLTPRIKPHRTRIGGGLDAWWHVLPGAARRKVNKGERIQLRSQRGAEIARKLGLSNDTAAAIHALDEHWDGSGYSEGLAGEAIPLLARILAVAQHLDVIACERTPEAAIDALTERSGTWYDPRLVRVARTLDQQEMLWTDCLRQDNPEATRQLALDLQPDTAHGMQPGEIDRICEAFAEVVDAKSPFTYRHSIGVAEVAHEIALALALPGVRCQLVRRAALLHDLGKLAVPNTILDKRGQLTPEEWAVVVEHPRLTREILARIRPFAEMAAIAGAHHERLDGTGYPDKLKEEALCIEARIIAVADFYRALTEDRPYRMGIPHDDAMAILRKQARALDTVCIDALDLARGHHTETPYDSRKPPGADPIGHQRFLPATMAG